MDVYLVDLRGYGQSTRPPEMDQPAKDNKPIVTTDVAVRDVGTAVDWIFAAPQVQQLNLLGWSWGTSIMATYAAANQEKVDKLALYAPLWLRNTPPCPGRTAGRIPHGDQGAGEEALAHRGPRRQAGGSDPAGLVRGLGGGDLGDRPGQRQAGPGAAARTQRRDPGRARLLDGRKPYYDPATISAATLLIQAEWDQDTPAYMAQALFPAAHQRGVEALVDIGEGTHTVIMEKNRLQLFREVQLFLDE